VTILKQSKRKEKNQQDVKGYNKNTVYYKYTTQD